MPGGDEQMVGQAVQIGQRMRIDRRLFVKRDRGSLGPPHNGPAEVEHCDCGRTSWQDEAFERLEPRVHGVNLFLEPFDALFAAGFAKVPGRVIWTSSPDRGLHWLLQEWPMIRRAVPHATLRVFYPMDGWLERMAAVTDGPPDILEQKQRAAFIRERRTALERMGVEFYGGASRVEISKEIAAAECLPYSCDPVRPTEGFSCSVMESSAAQSCPIVTNADAFPEIYGGALPMVDLPLSKNAPVFRDLVIRALTDKPWRDEVNAKARTLAERFTWRKATERMMAVLEEHLGRRVG